MKLDKDTQELISTLSDKEAEFVRHYLVENHGTKAALAAGYAEASAHVTASRLLRKAKIKAILDHVTAKAAKKLDITAERVLAEYARIGFADIRQAVSWKSDILTYAPDPDGKPASKEEGDVEDRGEPIYVSTVKLINSEELPAEVAAAIAEVSQNDKGGLKIKFHDKKGALDSLAKHLGILTDKTEVSVTVTHVDRIAAARERINARRQQPAAVH